MRKPALGEYSEIDWTEFNQVLAGNGPCNRERLAARRKAHDEGAWVREAAAGLCREAPAAVQLAASRGIEEVTMATPNIPLLWEVFIRSRNGLAHKHVRIAARGGYATMALQAARDIYTRRGEGLSIWVVPSNAITASDPSEKGMMFEPAESKIYRHPTFYDVPGRSRTYVIFATLMVRRRQAPSRTMAGPDGDRGLSFETRLRRSSG